MVHLNIFGLVKQPSISGYRYMVTFIDNFHRFSWIYFLKEKYEVFEKFTRKSMNLPQGFTNKENLHYMCKLKKYCMDWNTPPNHCMKKLSSSWSKVAISGTNRFKLICKSSWRKVCYHMCTYSSWFVKAHEERFAIICVCRWFNHHKRWFWLDLSK